MTTELADRFAQIAQEHVRLLQEIRAFRVTDPQVQALREAAAAALQGAPNHDLARAKLEEARNSGAGETSGRGQGAG